MIFVSRVSAEFWEQYNALPKEIQQLADKAYKLFSENPHHPSLALKKVKGYWSARLTKDYRVLGYQKGNEFFWFWIGPHDEYERLINH